ncbi:MAG: type II toxin-antitoxin system VapC family toxin [Candidatus Rokubacteria bacterium]|nr:type II toxin-antitoxin system VapC family toxin [Candidatus Rokubacteria bacterium]MBI3824927.1 type II toxin-antitoxin system VapC family toxin [Candidatus Rokubacteria bacterium]
MSRLVVDASVGVKWFLPEPDDERALALLRSEHDLSAPDLMYPEVGNALWKRCRRGDLTLRDVDDAVDRLLAAPIIVHPSSALLPLALTLALRMAQPVYDCLYVAAALAHDGRLVTADRRLLNAFGRGPLSRRVVAIEDVR